jgi:hypothetical protein
MLVPPGHASGASKARTYPSQQILPVFALATWTQREPEWLILNKEQFMRLPSRSVVLFGSALALFFATSAFAQTAPAPNPFGNTAQATTPTPNTPAPKKKRAAAAPKTGQFTTEAEAKSSCPSDTVVWVNTGTKVYHHAGTSAYGKTKRGVYMCEKETAAAGFRAAKNEKKSS